MNGFNVMIIHNLLITGLIAFAIYFTNSPWCLLGVIAMIKVAKS